MNEINTLHNEAMYFAELSFVANKKGKEDLASDYLCTALCLERDAAEMLKNNLEYEPTRSILYRSAATLAIQLDLYREAERLASAGLTGNPPFEIIDELHEVQETATFKSNLAKKGMHLEKDEVNFSLAGESTGYGIIEANLFIKKLRFVQNALIRTFERGIGRNFRPKGPLPKSIRDEFQCLIMAPQPGSFSVTIKIGRGEQVKLFENHSQNIIGEFIECVDLFANNRLDELRKRIKTDDYYDNFIGLINQLKPDGKQIKRVGFTSNISNKQKIVVIKNEINHHP